MNLFEAIKKDMIEMDMMTDGFTYTVETDSEFHYVHFYDKDVRLAYVLLVPVQ